MYFYVPADIYLMTNFIHVYTKLYRGITLLQTLIQVW